MVDRHVVSLTKNIPEPNIYVQMLAEYQGWIFLEEEALNYKNQWARVFPKNLPLDLEIGCGNGFFFEHRARQVPTRNLLGIEIKYKPLVQTIRRVKRGELHNARGIRFQAKRLDLIFGARELDDCFIFFPDPWPRKRQHKHRLLRRVFFEMLHPLQKPGSKVIIKTDSEDYFDAFTKEIPTDLYEVDRLSRDLHHSPWADENFMTAFERIFVKKGQPIFYAQLTNKEQK